MGIDDVVVDQKTLRLPQTIPLAKVAALVVLLLAIYLGLMIYDAYSTKENQTLSIISSPKVNDIYFLDYRL